MQTEESRDHWSVSVAINGDNVLTIESNFLSGAKNIDAHADVIRGCARHLLSFIGPEPSSASALYDACASVWAHLGGTDDPALRRIADECRSALSKASEPRI